jgi:hypothetical protein
MLRVRRYQGSGFDTPSKKALKTYSGFQSIKEKEKMRLGITNIHNHYTSFSKQTYKWMTLKVNYWWLIVFSLLLRILPFTFSATSSLVDLKRVCIILSYILLLFALSRNIHIRGTLIVAFGTFLNFLAILENGGFMPVSPEARHLAGKALVDLSSGEIILTQSGGVVLPIEQTRLCFLTDIIPISVVHTVFSVGDVIIGIGILVICINLVIRMVKRRICLF